MENYYDVRIDSNGDITWHGDGRRFDYDPSADYDAVFAGGLDRLVQQEAEHHVIPEDTVKNISRSGIYLSGRSIFSWTR